MKPYDFGIIQLSIQGIIESSVHWHIGELPSRSAVAIEGMEQKNERGIDI